MANCCVTFLFFSYAAATVIYLVIAGLAMSGNAKVLIAHSKLENGTALLPKEREEVKSRTYAQYFLASGCTLVISVLLFFLCIFRSSKGYRPLNQNINKIIEEKEPKVLDYDDDDDNDNENNINTKSDNLPIELARQTNTNVDSPINEEEDEGMKEEIN